MVIILVESELASPSYLLIFPGNPPIPTPIMVTVLKSEVLPPAGPVIWSREESL